MLIWVGVMCKVGGMVDACMLTCGPKVNCMFVLFNNFTVFLKQVHSLTLELIDSESLVPAKTLGS